MPEFHGSLSVGGTVESDNVTPDNFLNIYLMDGSTVDMVVDGSGTPVNYEYTVPANKRAQIHRVLIFLDDTTAFGPNLFGGITALPNGITITAGGILLATWQDNVDMVTTMHDFIGFANLGKSDKSGSGRWSFSRTGGALTLAAGQTFTATINDAMTGLDNMRMRIQGHIEDV